MKFKGKLLQGILIKRYKRFFVDIQYKNKIITAHCPNSGSMLGLLVKGNKVWFSQSNNPKRKLKFTLEIIEVDKKMVGINTLLTNKIVFEGLKQKKIKGLIEFDNIKSEVKFNKGTRFDFLIFSDKKKTYLEVKNVTLVRKDKLAEFPDSITSRGKKHLEELIKAIKKGFKSNILFLIQREDCESFNIANDIDKEYEIAFKKAMQSGVKILCYDCKINTEEIILNKEIELI